MNVNTLSPEIVFTIAAMGALTCLGIAQLVGHKRTASDIYWAERHPVRHRLGQVWGFLTMLLSLALLTGIVPVDAPKLLAHAHQEWIDRLAGWVIAPGLFFTLVAPNLWSAVRYRSVPRRHTEDVTLQAQPTAFAVDVALMLVMSGLCGYLFVQAFLA